MQTPSHATRWELTEETFAGLLRSLHAEERLAVERYRRLHGRLVLLFMRHRSYHPEDLADEVINRLARKLADGQAIENMEAFALGIGRLVVREEVARTMREQNCYLELGRSGVGNGLDPLLTPNESATNTSDLETLMEDQWTALPVTAQTMLARYHQGNGIGRIRERQKLAAEMGVSIGTLRKRIFDLQAMLRMKLKQAVYATQQTHNGKEKPYL